ADSVGAAGEYSKKGEGKYGQRMTLPSVEDDTVDLEMTFGMVRSQDSCFNISHCQKHGHELVAAASLRPKDGIVGQDAIEYVAQALDVPLYRRVIEGSAVEMGNEYGTRAGIRESVDQSVPGDETEDLFYLLQDVIVCKSQISYRCFIDPFRRTTPTSKASLLVPFFHEDPPEDNGAVADDLN
ncbi:15211_t:CDS:2, partial [Acaulospora colombiana]